MNHRFFKRSCVFVVSLALLGLSAPMASYARIIDTQTYVQSSGRDANFATVRAGLNRADVRDRFEALGVDPAGIETRLAALTDAELDRLAGQMERMPAGGSALAVVGIVFVVLVILELVGVIDVFKKT